MHERLDDREPLHLDEPTPVHFLVLTCQLLPHVTGHEVQSDQLLQDLLTSSEDLIKQIVVITTVFSSKFKQIVFINTVFSS